MNRVTIELLTDDLDIFSFDGNALIKRIPEEIGLLTFRR